jgi:hypothetical protein
MSQFDTHMRIGLLLAVALASATSPLMSQRPVPGIEFSPEEATVSSAHARLFGTQRRQSRSVNTSSHPSRRAVSICLRASASRPSSMQQTAVQPRGRSTGAGYFADVMRLWMVMVADPQILLNSLNFGFAATSGSPS